jgi:hypothetical protein
MSGSCCVLACSTTKMVFLNTTIWLGSNQSMPGGVSAYE